jgi:peptidyl-dipeptidase A
MNQHPFHHFLSEFVPPVAKKSKQLNQAFWILETTGSGDAADLKADLDGELRMLFNSQKVYEQLLAWRKDPMDPVLKRQLNVLIRLFKQNQVPQQLLEDLARKEADLAQSYASFRPEIEGRSVSENEIREILKTEGNVEKRKVAWEASKQIGVVLATQILELVRLRNEAAHSLGYSDYFQMMLDLQEVDPQWLLKTLDDLANASESAHSNALMEINGSLSKRFGTVELGPWAWSEPFGQEDPLDNQELDTLVEGVDLAAASIKFYKQMAIDVEPILKRSDMYERPGKNQHAFCINMDRGEDVRNLNNVCASLKWLETVLHELGHAIYELGFDSSLPWLLREPPHMITTEAMALLAGRQAYRIESLDCLIGPSKNPALQKVEGGLKRRQLIFSRWVLVMTEFESQLYSNPEQDLNQLWWKLVEKHQKISPPKQYTGGFDWACKYHIGLAPVYYFSYLLGEMFASAIQESLSTTCGDTGLSNEKTGKFLQEKLFCPGNRLSWSDLITHVTGHQLTAKAWVKEFC